MRVQVVYSHHLKHIEEGVKDQSESLPVNERDNMQVQITEKPPGTQSSELLETNVSDEGELHQCTVSSMSVKQVITSEGLTMIEESRQVMQQVMTVNMPRSMRFFWDAGRQIVVPEDRLKDANEIEACSSNLEEVFMIDNEPEEGLEESTTHGIDSFDTISECSMSAQLR